VALVNILSTRLANFDNVCGLNTPLMSPDAANAHLLHVQQLYVQHLPALRGFVLSLVSDFTLVDDVVQETFLTITKKAGDFRLGSNFRAWTWSVARFKLLQTLEAARKRADRLSPEVIDALCAHEDAEDNWRTEHQLQTLSACIEQLAPKAKQAITLRYEHAHRPPEIARVMGWGIEAVNVALSRARVALRKCMEQRLAVEGA
jgi:RNA polymerase sigma-70 factor, ECF subfamily